MPPSTVFSYWRRDHRRSSASPVSSVQQQPTSKGVADNLPQIPVISNTPELTTTIDGSSGNPDGTNNQAVNETSSDLDALKLNLIVSSSNAPSSSSTNLVVPWSSSEKQARPHSSPEEREKEKDPALTAQTNHSQWSFTAPRPDHGEGDSSKPNSPFRLSFGKGLLNHHSQSSDNNKRSSTPGTGASGFRFKASPDDSPADKTAAPKEFKMENTSSRRPADRDVSVDQSHHKSGKAMLHLLNPMSLLARRRSSQIAGSRTDDMNIGTRNLVPALPDDYDPRIRGKIVHDFSAPRPRRNLSATPNILQDAASQNNVHESSPQAGSEPQAQGTDLASPGNELRQKPNQYSPVFKEHFEDDQKVLQVENKAYLQSPLLTNPQNQDNEQSLPVFARKLPSKVPDQEEKSNEQAVLDPEPAPDSADKQTPANEPEQDTAEIIPQQRSGLPRHLKSNASRFSFDMNCVESSVQEKLLEEKHKEKEAARRAKKLEDGDFSDIDDYDNDVLDDLDDFEERIPGVNVDNEEDEFSGFSGAVNMNKSWLTPGLSPIIASPITPAPNTTTDSTQDTQPSASGANHGLALNDSQSYFPQNLVSEATMPPQQMNTESASEKPQIPVGMNPGPSQMADDDDDLYFDDGEFGDLTADAGGETFDESIFDDETSHLYDRKRHSDPMAPDIEETEIASDASSENADFASGVNNSHGLKHVPSMASEYTGNYSLSERFPKAGPSQAQGGVLSEHNLEALHTALAKAAKDKLERNVSMSDRSLGQDSITQTAQTADSRPGLVSDDSHPSQGMEALCFEEAYEDFNYDDYDDLYDDPIIAAANAEALENDDEGFYGDEFGFYAQAVGASELTNGGYFGPRHVEGITRSFSSSRGKFREPSLTPITERSEWSTRNSVISLGAHGAASSNQPLSSPGLAQLVDMGNIEDEMSLSALMKLRRGAWGGSNGSLRSSSGSPPPNPHSSSNRASFAALSDASPTVQPIPADFMGTGATTSPI